MKEKLLTLLYGFVGTLAVFGLMVALYLGVTSIRRRPSRPRTYPTRHAPARPQTEDIPTAWTPPEPSRPSPEDKLGAWIMAKEFVKDAVRSPSTADFGDGLLFDEQDFERQVTYLGEDEYQVTGWVDAQNAFGATIRTNWIVRVKDRGGGKWRATFGPVFIER